MNKFIAVGIFLLLTFGFISHYILAGQAVYGDGLYYWMLTRSVVIDHDLTLNNESAHHYDWTGNNTQEKSVPIPPETTKSRALELHLPIGTSILWLPWFFLADGIAHLLLLFNHHLLLNGYADVYQITVGLGVLMYVMIGILALFKLLTHFYSKQIAYIAISVVLFASNLFYYTSLDILNSHPLAFALSSILVLFLFQFTQKPSYRLSFLIGLIYGLQVITRTQDTLFIFPILITFWYTVKQMKRRSTHLSIFQIALFLLLFLISSLLTLSPQLIIWQTIYGGISHIPYIQGAKPFDLWHPQLVGMLVNAKTGLLFYSPILVICFLGIYPLYRSHRYLGITALVMIVSQYYLIASWGAWEQAASYGIRMLISCIPYFILGLAAAVASIMTYKRAYRLCLMLGVVFIVINMIGIFVFQMFINDPTIDMGHTTRQDHLEKFSHLLHL